MRRRTKIVLAITFMVAALVTTFSYIYISQLLRQRITTAQETASLLTSQTGLSGDQCRARSEQHES